MTDMTRNADRYFWFDEETTDELARQLNESGPCRLEVHKIGNQIWLHVVPNDLRNAGDEERAVAGFQPLDKSHVCPPDCP